LDGTAATDKLLILFKGSLTDPDDGPPFWLSLAATQFRYGRLEDRVRDQALRVIDDGSDIARFEGNAKLLRTRSKVLQRLRAQLLGPQREATKVRRETPSECDWEPGEVVGYQRGSGEWIPFHVQGIGERRGSRYPVVCVLDLPFDRIDDATEDTPVRRVFRMPLSIRSRAPEGWTEPTFGRHPNFFVIFGLRKRDLVSTRLARTKIRLEPKIKVEGDGLVQDTYLVWKGLDAFLDTYLASP
jgi:hypothetical protein